MHGKKSVCDESLLQMLFMNVSKKIAYVYLVEK